MKTRIQNLFVALALLSTLNLQPLTAFAQGTAFTYQGRLNDGGGPANGSYDLKFTIYDTNQPVNNLIAGPVTNSVTGVTNGLFTVTVDFGAGVFAGNPRWLEIAARTNGNGAFTTLSPRQAIKPAPYAIFANTSSNLSGTLPVAQLSGTIANGNLPASPNFSGTVTAGAFTTSNLTVNGNLILPAGTTSTGIIYSGTNTMIVNLGNGTFFAGSGAGNLAMTGQGGLSGNTALGNGSLTADTIGYYNTALGYAALSNNINGSGNTAAGALALQLNTSGSQNTAFGVQALQSNTVAGANTAVGYQALFSNNGGGNNTVVGFAALAHNTGGSANTAVGSQALLNNIDGANNTMIGFAAGYYSTGSDNTGVGERAMFLNTGSANTAVGEITLQFNSGIYNTAIGISALDANTSGNFNTANGANAMVLNSIGNFNTAVGYQALYNSVSDGNIALGYQAGISITGANNIDIGNLGVASENNTIRIGNPNTHTITYIAGVINGVGSGLTSLQATQLVGPVLSPQISGLYGGVVNFTNSANNFAGNFSGNGGGLFNVPAAAVSGSLPASQLSGTVPDARLSANVALLNANQTFTGTNTFAGTSILPGLRLQPNASTNGSLNVIGGSSVNFVSNGVVGAVISGGGATNYNGAAFTNGVDGDFGTVSGGAANTAGNSAAVGGGYHNTASGDGATVSGGYANTASNYSSTVGGGDLNTASGDHATVGGGEDNTAGGDHATVGGGYSDTASGDYTTVGGGFGIIANGDYGTVGGGQDNTASGKYATVGGGQFNTANGYYATVPGGEGNTATGDSSFAAGFHAIADDGSFVWSDASGGGFASTALNQFAVRAAGGVLFSANVQIGTNNSDYHRLALGGGNSSGFLYGSFAAFSDGIHLGYNYYADAAGGGHVVNAGGGTSRITTDYGGIGMYIGNAGFAPTIQRFEASISGVTVYGTFNNMSDRNAKQDFAPVSPSQILGKVTRLPVSEWSYKEDSATRHIGPVAQDFYSVFNIGTDDKHIAPIDEGGVALAAIQGLNEKVESGRQKAETRIEKLEAENAELKARLEKLEQLISAKNGGAE